MGSPLKEDNPDLDDMFTEGTTLNIAKVDKPRCASRYTPLLPPTWALTLEPFSGAHTFGHTVAPPSPKRMGRG